MLMEEVHWYFCLSLPRTSLRYHSWRRVYAACHHVGAGSISPEKDGALLGQTAKRFHPPTSWVSTLARRWEWVWTCKNVEKRTQLCPVLLEPNWSWTRSDKMRGEILRLGSEPWKAAQRDVRPHRRVCRSSLQGPRPWGYRVCRDCTVQTVRPPVATGTAPARLQLTHTGQAAQAGQGRRAIRTVPVSGSRSGYGNADHVGPMSADLPDVQGEGGRRVTTEAGFAPVNILPLARRTVVHNATSGRPRASPRPCKNAQRRDLDPAALIAAKSAGGRDGVRCASDDAGHRMLATDRFWPRHAKNLSWFACPRKVHTGAPRLLFGATRYGDTMLGPRC